MATMIGLAVADGIATLTLDRPPVNAFNAPMFAAFTDALDRLGERSDWSVLHIRSALSAFSAGADLVEVIPTGIGSADSAALAGERVVRDILTGIAMRRGD